jgi:hypothetical protein
VSFILTGVLRKANEKPENNNLVDDKDDGDDDEKWVQRHNHFRPILLHTPTLIT